MMQHYFKRAVKNCKNEDGQAMIEFSLYLPLILIILVFMIMTYEYFDELISTNMQLRYSMRQEIDQTARGGFRLIRQNRNVIVQVPGRLKRILHKAMISKEMRFQGYGGCYQGRDKSRYSKHGRLYRKIN